MSVDALLGGITALVGSASDGTLNRVIDYVNYEHHKKIKSTALLSICCMFVGNGISHLAHVPELKESLVVGSAYLGVLVSYGQDILDEYISTSGS